MKRIGSRNGRDTRWRVFNLPWPDNANGKAVVTEKTPVPENSDPQLDLMVSELLKNIDNIRGFQGWLEEVFGDNSEMARSFAEKCGKQVEFLERARKGAELYAAFVDSMNAL